MSQFDDGNFYILTKMLEIIRERRRALNPKVAMSKKKKTSSNNTTQQDESVLSDYSDKIEIEDLLVINDIEGVSIARQRKLERRLTIFFMSNLIKEVVKYYWDLFEALEAITEKEMAQIGITMEP